MRPTRSSAAAFGGLPFAAGGPASRCLSTSASRGASTPLPADLQETQADFRSMQIGATADGVANDSVMCKEAHADIPLDEGRPLLKVRQLSRTQLVVPDAIAGRRAAATWRSWLTGAASVWPANRVSSVAEASQKLCMQCVTAGPHPANIVEQQAKMNMSCTSSHEARLQR